MDIPINLVFEDELSEAFMKKLAEYFGHKYLIIASYTRGGYGYIKNNIKAFNNASKGSVYFILTDLDNYSCPLELMDEWLGLKNRRHNLLFRVAIKEVESWALADIIGFSDYFGVSERLVPRSPDTVSDPKKVLIDIVRKSKKKSFKQDILPVNENAKVGPNYNARMIDFVNKKWSINSALKNSESLNRAYHALDRFVFILPE